MPPGSSRGLSCAARRLLYCSGLLICTISLYIGALAIFHEKIGHLAVHGEVFSDYHSWLYPLEAFTAGLESPQRAWAALSARSSNGTAFSPAVFRGSNRSALSSQPPSSSIDLPSYSDPKNVISQLENDSGLGKGLPSQKRCIGISRFVGQRSLLAGATNSRTSSISFTGTRSSSRTPSASRSPSKYYTPSSSGSTSFSSSESLTATVSATPSTTSSLSYSPSMILATASWKPATSNSTNGSGPGGDFNITSPNSSPYSILVIVSIAFAGLSLVAIVAVGACLFRRWSSKRQHRSKHASPPVSFPGASTVSVTTASSVMADGGVITQPVRAITSSPYPNTHRRRRRGRSRRDYRDSEDNVDRVSLLQSSDNESAPGEYRGYTDSRHDHHIAQYIDNLNSLVGQLSERVHAIAPLPMHPQAVIASPQQPQPQQGPDEDGYYPKSRGEFLEFIRGAVGAAEVTDDKRSPTSALLPRSLTELPKRNRPRSSLSALADSVNTEDLKESALALRHTEASDDVDGRLERILMLASDLERQWRKVKKHRRRMRSMESEVLLSEKNRRRRRSRRRSHQSISDHDHPHQPQVQQALGMSLPDHEAASELMDPPYLLSSLPPSSPSHPSRLSPVPPPPPPVSPLDQLEQHQRSSPLSYLRSSPVPSGSGRPFVQTFAVPVPSASEWPQYPPTTPALPQPLSSYPQVQSSRYPTIPHHQNNPSQEVIIQPVYIPVPTSDPGPIPPLPISAPQPQPYVSHTPSSLRYIGRGKQSSSNPRRPSTGNVKVGSRLKWRRSPSATLGEYEHAPICF